MDHMRISGTVSHQQSLAKQSNLKKKNEKWGPKSA